MLERTERFIDRVRRVVFVTHELPLIAAGVAVSVGTYFGNIGLYFPQLSNVLAAFGVGAAVCISGLMIRHRIGASTMSAMAKQHGTPDVTRPVEPDPQALRLRQLAATQRRNIDWYVHSRLREVNFDGMILPSPYFEAVVEVQNGFMFDLSLTKGEVTSFAFSEIMNPNNWGNLDPPRYGPADSTIDAGRQTDLTLRFFPNLNVAERLQKLQSDRSEIRYRFSIAWDIHFDDVNRRHQFAATLTEIPKRSGDRQQ